MGTKLYTIIRFLLLFITLSLAIISCKVDFERGKYKLTYMVRIPRDDKVGRHVKRHCFSYILWKSRNRDFLNLPCLVVKCEKTQINN